jgi:predicted DNA-binding transcriptional regulator YafY
MPARLRHRIDTLQITAVERPTDSQVDSGVLIALSAAVHAREVLRFDYTSASVNPGAEPPPRRVEPHHLVTWGGRWYLVAWDLDRGDWRTFRADRIIPRTPTGPRFTPRELPGGAVAAFIISKFQGNAGWPCRGEVILELAAAFVLQYVRDAVVEELGPKRSRVTMGSWSWPGLAATLGRFDADIEVVGPPELKAAFAQLARRYEAAAGTESLG